VKLITQDQSSLSVSQLNFIKYNGKYLLEINEKIMQILKYIIQNTDNYDDFYDWIDENKLTGKKIVATIDKNLNIKIITKIREMTITSLDTILKNYASNKLLKEYIRSI
jgi:hypothetical protein